jgi:DNA-directed RNA polymerase specialized sigma24 family protein
MPSPPSLFPATRWTVVRRMKDGSRRVRLEGWNEFCVAYWPALVCWLQGQGISSPDAHDLVQGLLEKLWRNGDFVDRLSPEGGKLRSFLLHSLRNWQTEVLRFEARQKRGGNADHLELADSMSGPDSEHSFDQLWARGVLSRACAALRSEYLRRGNGAIFDRILPLVDSRDPDKARIAADALGITMNSLNVSLKRLRERLARCLREEVSATMADPDPAQVDDELRHLLASFGRHETLGDLVSCLSPSASNTVSLME